MAIVLMTTNRWKIPEYRRFLARHAQEVVVEPPSEMPGVIASYLDAARAVLADESNIFDPASDLVEVGYVGLARNICRLHDNLAASLLIWRLYDALVELEALAVTADEAVTMLPAGPTGKHKRTLAWLYSLVGKTAGQASTALELGTR